MTTKPGYMAGLNGPRGLLVAVIATAAEDLASGKRKHRDSALEYFASPLFRHHLTWLGLAPDLLPEGVEEPEPLAPEAPRLVFMSEAVQ